MKKILFLLLSISAFAQVPQGISYQAIALNGSGNPVVSGNVGIRLSLMDNAATGTVIYKETHTKTTNAQGLFNLVIGQGTAITGTFAAVNWGTNSKFLKVELDAAGGTNYVAVGTTQLLSVPYAMYAASTSSVPASSLNGIGTTGLKSSAFIVLDNSIVKGYANGAWSSQSFSQVIYNSDVIADGGNFLILDNNSAKVFSNGNWTSQTFNQIIYTSDVVYANGSYLVVDNSSVKAFGNGAWSTQSFSQVVYPSDIIASGDTFIVLDNSTVKAYYNGVWTSQAFNQVIYNSMVTSANGTILITDNNSVKSFYKGVWTTQSFSQTIYTSDIINSDKN
ncbi:MAG: hypothetical protein PSV16_08225 [Flavobacterium sp.]|nr:hypothetical protein [Flavobacterium sp.]